MKRGNSDIQSGDYVFLDVQHWKGKDKLGGHTEGQFLVLGRTQLTLVIHRDKLVEIVNSDLMFKAPPPMNSKLRGELRANSDDVRENNFSGHDWFVMEILYHTAKDGNVSLNIDWEGHYEPSWEPRRNDLEELISRYLVRKRREYR